MQVTQKLKQTKNHYNKKRSPCITPNVSLFSRLLTIVSLVCILPRVLSKHFSPINVLLEESKVVIHKWYCIIVLLFT